MKQLLALTFVAALGVTPAQSQDEDISEGMSLLQEGSRLLHEGLMKEIGPALLELEGKIVDLNTYHMPEVLPNGDIIIRRKAPLMPELDDGETEL